MSRGLHRARLLAAALALLVGTFAGAGDLVLCIGANGHRALELEQPGMACPTLASQLDATGVSGRPPTGCLDLPAAGSTSASLSSTDPDRVPPPPSAFPAPRPEPVPLIQARPAGPIIPRADPAHLAELRSTVLLV